MSAAGPVVGTNGLSYRVHEGRPQWRRRPTAEDLQLLASTANERGNTPGVVVAMRSRDLIRVDGWEYLPTATGAPPDICEWFGKHGIYMRRRSRTFATSARTAKGQR